MRETLFSWIPWFYIAYQFTLMRNPERYSFWPCNAKYSKLFLNLFGIFSFIGCNETISYGHYRKEKPQEFEFVLWVSQHLLHPKKTTRLFRRFSKTSPQYVQKKWYSRKGDSSANISRVQCSWFQDYLSSSPLYSAAHLGEDFKYHFNCFAWLSVIFLL